MHTSDIEKAQARVEDHTRTLEDRHPLNEWGIFWSNNDVVRAIQFTLAEDYGLRPQAYNLHRGLVLKHGGTVYINLLENGVLRLHTSRNVSTVEEFFDPNDEQSIKRLLVTAAKWSELDPGRG